MSNTRPEVTVVTGASAGIGKAIAQALLERGATVVNMDRELPCWTLGLRPAVNVVLLCTSR